MQVLGQKPAKHWTANARARKHGADIALISAALDRWHHVGNDGLREREQSAATEALQATRHNQNRHGGCDRAGDRRDREYADSKQKHGPSPIIITELAIEWRHRRRSQKV